MSAIWGFINLDGSEVSDELGKSMMIPYDKYKIDSFKYLKKDNIFFGCGMQYITPESNFEVLPYRDKEEGLIITADAIIDNRDELFVFFEMSAEEGSKITDSELILLAYKKWGSACTDYIIGDFAFVIYDEKNKEIFCARDHAGNRTLYYYYNKKIFAFSTIEKPLFEVMDKPIQLDEKWMGKFIAIRGVLHEGECERTPYKDMSQVAPANRLIIKNGKLNKEVYWDPLKNIEPLNLKSDKEYDEAFRKVYFEAIKCRLRTNEDVGIMLSGGMDSGSVACIAATILKDEKRIIKGFTSVPLSTFKDELPKNLVADESDYVKSMESLYDNLKVLYCDSESEDPISEIDRGIGILEQPYKIIENLYWYDNLSQIASDNGCKVLLNGQFGNCTVSYGEFYTHILTMWKKGKVFTLMNDTLKYCDLYKRSKKKTIKNILDIITQDREKGPRKKSITNSEEIVDTCFLKSSLLSSLNIIEELNNVSLNLDTHKVNDLKGTHKFMVNPVAFSHISQIECKLSLANGIQIRDATRDKRIIEFILRLPSEQFVKNGMVRHIIRSSLKGIVPDKIRLNINTRGYQSADWIQRVIPKWEMVISEVKEYMKIDDINQFIDIDKVKVLLKEVGNSPTEASYFSVRTIIIVLIVYRYLNNFKLNGGEIYGKERMGATRVN